LARGAWRIAVGKRQPLNRRTRWSANVIVSQANRRAPSHPDDVTTNGQMRLVFTASEIQ